MNTKKSEKESVFNDSILHEELFGSRQQTFNSLTLPNTNGSPNISASAVGMQAGTNPENLVNQSISILRDYLSTAAPIRQQYIENLLKEKNYWELTQFFFRGQKIRGSQPITNETDFLNQEKESLLMENNSLNTSFSAPAMGEAQQYNSYAFKDEIWIALLKKCQKKLYDQEALKNYVSLKKEKYEIQKQRHEKYLKNRFQRIKESILENPEIFSSSSAQNKQNFSSTKQKNGFPSLSNSEKKKIENFENFSGYPSSFNKAVKESILWENNSIASSSFQTIDKLFGADRFANRGKKLFLEKTNIRKNQFPMYSSFEKENVQKRESLVREAGISALSLPNSPTKINSSKQRSLLFAKNLRFSVKKQALQILQAEKNVQEKFETFQPMPRQGGLEKSRSFSLPKIFLSTFEKAKTILWNVFRFQNIFGFQENLNQNMQNFSSQNQRKFSFFFSRKKSNLFDPTEGKNFRFVDEFWKKRENILAKRKKLRKTFKRLRNQKTPTEKIFFENSDFFMPFSEHKNLSTENRQKMENFQSRANLEFLKKQKSTRSRLWKKYLGKPASDQQENTQKNMFSFLSGNGLFFFSGGAGAGLGEKKFQRKRSRLRRYSSFKGRGPIKKRTLREKLKRQFKSLKKYGRNQMIASEQIAKEREKKKVELIQYITQRKYEADGKFLKRDEKQRRTRQTKHRAWKKKKQNFAQKRRKLRKRRRSTTSKIRVLNKKISRILSRKEIQTWWWKTFFPHFQKTAEKTWQLQKNMQIRKQLFELSEKEIFERDQKNRIGNISSLQIGDKDFKPFAIPEALRIRDKLVQQNVLHFDNLPPPSVEKKENFDFLRSAGNSAGSFIPIRSAAGVESRVGQKSRAEKIQTSTQVEQKETNLSMLQNKTVKSFEFDKSGQIFEKVNNLILNEERKTEKFSNSPFFVPTNPLPFYAGWDESLCKFIITNRFLSRKECFSCSLDRRADENKTFFGSQSEKQQKQTGPLFRPLVGEEQSPLKGMNAATTLYWQIPFTTYDPDQFFALGMDGFSPIGWRNFSLNHSKQTTKPILVKNFLSFEQNEQHFSKNLQYKIFQQNFSKKNFVVQQQKNEIEKNFEYRRVLKKQKRLKKHPRPPVWFPSGSLSQQVLPVHYIYVFYKRSRLPRDRYIRRRLRSTFLKNQNSNSPQNGENSLFVDRTRMVDFTLRKRTKPRRKYHRKRFGNISRGTDEKNEFLARRRKFRGFENETETTRPSSKIFQTSSLTGAKQEKRILRIQSNQGGSTQTKQRRKIQDSKQQTENLRVRQLRRRVQRQVYRPIWRSRPRAGGFVWPGDYLRLELVKASPLKTTNLSSPFAEGDGTGQSVALNAPKENETISQQSSSRKIRKKTRRTLQEWQVQPKRYLFEKHNLKVLKKRLEKSMNFN
jgi:hypothetical protein